MADNDDKPKLRLVDQIAQAATDVEALRIDGERHHHLSDQLKKTENRSRILSLARNGATAEQISEILAKGDPQRGIEGRNVSPAVIVGIIKKYLDRIHREDALTVEQLRVLENERIDALWSRLSSQMMNADGSVNVKIVDRLTRLSERRAKMNGLDAAQRHEHFIGDGLAALGLEEEHVRRARDAFRDTFLHQGIDDVVVAGEAEEITDPQLPAGA